MPQIVLLLEYRGTAYHGFQLQLEIPTIQGELEVALKRLTGEECRVRAAGRTDAGVHARGQVASFGTASHLPEAAFVAGLNSHLPGDIAVRAARHIEDSFDVRRHARSREYSYLVLNRATPSPLLADQAYWVKQPLDGGAMARAAQALAGRHDFRAFAAPLGNRSPVRTIYRAHISRKGWLLSFHFEADSFLPRQVRRMVGALLEMGRGRLSGEGMTALLEGTGTAEFAAPPWGLYLEKVNYDVQLFPQEDENL
ncbi:MAG: tRNA pseudouridine(38-40) synthase TruA [Chloroflexi bacterium]|nr:tRNA pseudouridine(38-40) synthase TruA [Chloroflexota bacterium]